jgi:hypothetical protein
MDCYCDYDPPEFYNVETRRARKQYCCVECNGPIVPNENYERVTGKWDGYISTFTTCERCHNLRVWAQNNLPCLCVMHGNMDDEIRIAVDDAVFRAPEETIGLRFGLLRRIHSRDLHNRQRKAA